MSLKHKILQALNELSHQRSPQQIDAYLDSIQIANSQRQTCTKKCPNCRLEMFLYQILDGTSDQISVSMFNIRVGDQKIRTPESIQTYLLPDYSNKSFTTKHQRQMQVWTKEAFDRLSRHRHRNPSEIESYLDGKGIPMTKPKKQNCQCVEACTYCRVALYLQAEIGVDHVFIDTGYAKVGGVRVKVPKSVRRYLRHRREGF